MGQRYLALLFFFCACLGAQEFRGTILGRITDPSGAVVVGALIRVVNTETNVVTTTTSNDQGNYQAPFLLPGDYTVSVEHAGFKKAERTNIRVSLDTRVAVDFTLEVGASVESVTVSAGAPLLDTVSGDLSQVVESAYVETVAVALNRNAVNFAQLAAGVTGTTGTYTSESQSNISISGGGSTRSSNEFLVDGIPNTVPRANGSIVFVPSLDSTQEVKIHTTMFDAAYGKTNGGVVQITTKSGTNKLHGAIYDFNRLRALNANSWTNNRLGLPKPPVNYYQWGYTVSGPVVAPRLYDGRNRTFFSTSLERDANKRSQTPQARVPTELERRGDFSQTLNRLGGPLSIYDPATTIVSGSTARRQPFPGARIPLSRQNPTGQAVLAAFAAPNQPGVAQIGKYNWAESGIYLVKQSQASIRIDHVLSDRQRLFGRFSRMVRDEVADEFFPGLTNVPVSVSLGTYLKHQWSVALDDTFTLSPSFVGSVRYGLARRWEEITTGGPGRDPSPLKLADIIVSNQAVKGYPTFNLGENMATIGASYSEQANDVHSLMSTLTKLTGRHSLKFGNDYRLVRWHRRSPGSAAPGNFRFSPTFTQSDPFLRTAADNSGTAMASLLLGAPDSGSLGYNSPVSVQQHYLAGFIQEDWKLLPRLTLNLGLRWEVETPYTERFNRVAFGFDREAKLPVQVPGMELRGGLLFAGVGGNPRREGYVDTNNFGPRFGFALAVNSKTVLRGGYGLFYAGQSSNTGFLGTVDVFNAVTPYVGSIDNGATLYTSLANPFPNGLRQPIGSSAGLLAQLGDSLNYFDQSRVSPYNQQWQFSIQRELPSRILVEAAYVGMLSLKQFESFELNEKPDRYLALGAAENNRVANPFYGVFPATSTLGQGSTIPQRRLWVAFPQFNSLAVEGANTGRAVYHALHMKVEKRLTHGLSVLWSYTNSKLMDNNTTSLVNERHYRAVSVYDQPQTMRMAFTYKLPVRIGRSVLKQAAEGWSLSGFLSMASGTPLSVTHANGRPIRIRNPRLSGPVHERLGDRRDAAGRVLNPYFDITAFVPLPDQYTITPEPPALDELRAPDSRGLNLSLFKSFPVRERLKLEVRMEISNFTNTPNFGAPGTNMSNAATFGVINSAGGGRSMQVGARLAF